ncbi:hypothetical protein MPSEU_000578900 [Mayamaea pseudoterrestris]|nr:hypothetical protein MPSEU_000578900 [Mayamaea pseudoterrestris]
MRFVQATSPPPPSQENDPVVQHEARGDMMRRHSDIFEMSASALESFDDLHGGVRYSETNNTSAGNEFDATTSVDDTPDIMLLNLYCSRAKAPKSDTKEAREEAALSWQPVREWLSCHDAGQVRAACEQRGESGLTAIHFAARNVPPLDVIDVFLSIAADTARLTDTFGWLPIHYACASGSDAEVIKALVDAYPESKVAVDRRGRTPLHFALGDKPATPDVVFLLSATGAARIADEIGMLPLHYACAFGASEEVLYVLTDAFPEAIESKDKRDRTPLHFALSNAGRKTVPSAVRLLLGLNPRIVNSIDKGPLPLRVLLEYAVTIKTEQADREEKRDSVRRCLEHLLNANPEPTADFLTSLQSLPEWLQEKAVVLPVVQHLLNEKISQRFPTAVLMMDFYILTIAIVSYSLNVVESISKRSNNDPSDDAIATSRLVPLYLVAGYFALREVVQIVSLLSLKSFHIWLYDPSNYVNVVFVVLMLFWSVQMNTGGLEAQPFRIGATCSVTIIWIKFLAYLRNMLIDFAVFVGGLTEIFRRLAAFLTALSVILIAFAQMFFTAFQQTEYCIDQPNDSLPEDVMLEDKRCDVNQIHSYCHFWDAFLNVYTMLLGEVSDVTFKTSGTATTFFVIFMFLVVILLANVLIAIVADSYKVIQDQRAAIVFWTNRLDFIAEMDAIANGPWKGRLRKSLGLTNIHVCADDADEYYVDRCQFGKEQWKILMDLFVDELEDNVASLDFLLYMVLRVLAFVVIPLWLLLGVVTAGWLWPPQVREAIFTSAVFKHSSDLERDNEMRRTQIKQLQEEVRLLSDDLLQEIAHDRTQLVHLKSHLAERKMEIANEMSQIKRIVAMLFERQSRFQG